MCSLFFFTLIGYNFIMFILLIFLSSLLSALLIWPLYLFASHFQDLFSISVSILLLFLLTFIIFRQIKKHGIKASLAFTAKLFTISAGLVLSFTLVLHGQRIFSLAVLLFSLAVFFLLSKIFKSNKLELSADKND
ncbi:MAG: hypothetical protein K5873_00940 [Treponema sp.]|nr:hypothetical protein [Treponema sp.]